MTLCKYCSNIPAKLFSFRRDDQCSYDHHPSLDALQGSAKQGCRGCQLFLHAVESSASDHAGRYKLSGEFRKWTNDEPVRLCSSKFGWQEVRINWTKSGLFRTFAVPSEWKDVAPVPGIELKDNSEYRAHEARLMQQWSKLCLEKHQCCADSKLFIPTRVIDVSTLENPNIRLIESATIESEDRRYLALSHCWGLAMPNSARTTSHTLERHMESISAEDLPLTFRDFIDIARRLEVKYVWIDSLCIIQDSREDWEKEAAQMASVYSKAYLTVSASSSSDGRGGCHVIDDVRSFGPVDFECQINTTNACSEPAIQRYRMWSRDTFPIGQVLSEDPLTSRGWCLQERELSPRVVHYSKDTIRWECRELRATLEFPWGDYAAFDVGRLFDGGSSARPTTFGNPINDSKPLADTTKQQLSWLEIVNRYTNRSLTRQTDVLPALSGIARSIAESTGDEYYAGLWKSNFAHCLLWASAWHVKSFKQHSRPLHYLAPSWSWASVKGPIAYLSWINGYWHSYNANPDPEYLPRIVDIFLDASSDPYGTLKAGSLKIEGKVAAGYTQQVAYAAPKDGSTVVFTPGPQDRLDILWGSPGGKVGEIRYDIPLCTDCAPTGSVRFIWLLCCMNSERFNDGTMRTFAIALQDADIGNPHDMPLRPPTRYRRVGVAWGIQADFWDSGARTTLTIV